MVALRSEMTVHVASSERVDAIIMDCVKGGMDIFGGTGMAAVLYHMETRFGLGERQIPHNPAGFVSALRYMFGVQARVIIHAIVEEMSKNATCDRGFLRFASALETSSVQDSDGNSNYLAKGGALSTETSNQDPAEMGSLSARDNDSETTADYDGADSTA